MLGLNFAFCSKLKVPAWRSILVLATESYLAKLLGQGKIDNFSGLWRGILLLAWLFEEGKEARGRRGAQSITFISQCLFEFIMFTFLAMFLIEFIRPPSPPLSSPSRCLSSICATDPNSS